MCQAPLFQTLQMSVPVSLQSAHTWIHAIKYINKCNEMTLTVHIVLNINCYMVDLASKTVICTTPRKLSERNILYTCLLHKSWSEYTHEASDSRIHDCIGNLGPPSRLLPNKLMA